MEYKYNKLYQAISEIVKGVDYTSIETYVNYVGKENALVLFQEIIDYCELNNLEVVTRDELNPLCRKYKLPILFSATNIINHNIDYDYYKDSIKYVSYSVGIIVFSEFILYGINLLFPTCNIFNLLSPLPIIMVTFYFVYNSFIKGVTISNVKRYKLFRRLFRKRSE